MSGRLLVLIGTLMVVLPGWAAPPAPGVEGPFLGVLTERMDPSDLKAMGVQTGVRVLSVVEGSPADRQVEEGDVITNLDRSPVLDPDAFIRDVAARPFDRAIVLTLVRGGTSRAVSVQPNPDSVLTSRSGLEAMARVGAAYIQIKFAPAPAPAPPPPPITPAPSNPLAPQPYEAFLGVSVSENPRAAEMEDAGQPRGALVRSVLTGSAAQLAGILVGDVLLWANGHPLNSAEDLTTMVRGMQPGALLQLVVQRGDQQLTLDASLGVREAR